MKLIEEWNKWEIQKVALIEKGYKPWQFQYGAYTEEGLHAWFWRKDGEGKKEVEIVTHNMIIHKDIMKYEW